jgi:hypothetical protein
MAVFRLMEKSQVLTNSIPAARPALVERSSSPLHYIALVLAAMNVPQFLIFNSRGILSWSGVGVNVTPEGHQRRQDLSKTLYQDGLR